MNDQTLSMCENPARPLLVNMVWPDGATHFLPAEGPGSSDTFWQMEGNEATGVWRLRNGKITKLELDKPYIGPVSIARLATRPAPTWNGEGPPPVGAKCEFRKLSQSKTWEWQAVFVNYMSEHTAVMEDVENPSGEHVHHPRTLEFRPIRTAEQIKAEEREKAINEMVEIIRVYRAPMNTPENPKGEARVAAQALYDAKFRQVAP